jgi:hypothetical protein
MNTRTRAGSVGVWWGGQDAEHVTRDSRIRVHVWQVKKAYALPSPPVLLLASVSGCELSRKLVCKGVWEM